MSGCRQMMDAAGEGLAPSLRAVDCMSGQLTTAAFDRLMGAHGALLPALTVILTLYIALFALALLAGRTRLGVGMLTGRMMSVALVLAFATSWAAYQQVVWQLASAAPDQIAGVVLGEKGSARPPTNSQSLPLPPLPAQCPPPMRLRRGCRLPVWCGWGPLYCCWAAWG